ncbi:MAG: AfsR/SARP family transcriptional regulator [Candidatus Xenobia bacterium]
MQLVVACNDDLAFKAVSGDLEAAIHAARYGSLRTADRYLQRTHHDSLDFTTSLCHSLWRAMYLSATGETSSGRALLTDGLARAIEFGQTPLIALATRFYAFDQFFRGDAPGALATLAEADDDLHVQALRSLVLLFHFGPAAADEELARGRAEAEQDPNEFASSAWNLVDAMSAFESVDLERCMARLQRMSRHRVPIQFRSWCERTRLLEALRHGRLDCARNAAAEMLRCQELHGNLLYAPECYWAVAQLQIAQGETRDAAASLQSALQLAEKSGLTYWRVKARAGLASCGVDVEANRQAACQLVRDGGHEQLWSSLGQPFPLVPATPRPTIIEHQHLKIRVLGSLEITRGKQEVLSPGVLADILKYLACCYDRECDDDDIGGTIWSEKPVTRSGYKSTISRLRTTLSPQCMDRYVVRRNSGYALRFDDLELDLRIFETHLDRVESLHADGLVAQAAEDLAAALALYRGPLLADYEAPWLVTRRREVARRLRRALTGAAELYLAAGDAASAAARLNEALKKWPGHQKAACRLIEVHLSKGNLGDARKVAEQTMRVRRRRNLPLGAELVRLQEEIGMS